MTSRASRVRVVFDPPVWAQLMDRQVVPVALNAQHAEMGAASKHGQDLGVENVRTDQEHVQAPVCGGDIRGCRGFEQECELHVGGALTNEVTMLARNGDMAPTATRIGDTNAPG